MKMLITNIDSGTQIAAPAFNIGSSGIGTWGNYFYAVIPQTYTDNVTPVLCGESTYGSIGMTGTIGLGLLSWTPQGNVDNYIIYKGTANGTFGTYMYGYVKISGTTGTWRDDNMPNTGTGASLGSFQMAWDKSVLIAQPDTYSPVFSNNIITHELFNFNTVISDRKNKVNITLGYSQIGSVEKYDLMQVYNWKQNLRVYPNVDGNPAIYFNVYWGNEWNFDFVSSDINTGYKGNVNLKGLEGLKNITEVV
jgi:hypothetical protein